MKWIVMLLFTAGVFFALWRYGYIEKFLGPWAAWAKWIGYFQ